MTRTRSALGALALIALIGTGCSDATSDGGADPGDRADAGTTTAPAATATAEKAAPKTKATPRDKAVRFAQCMRDNGVDEFPDPDSSGELTVDAIVNGSTVDPEGPAWKQAISACKDLQPAGFTGDRRTSPQQQAALDFAQCIRENGVKDFPDPAAGDPLIDTNKIPSAATDGGMAVLNAAMRTCREHVADFVGPR